MPEKIFLTYTNATAMPYTGSPIARHVVVNYIDSNGVHHTLQGLPAQKSSIMSKRRAHFFRSRPFQMA